MSEDQRNSTRKVLNVKAVLIMVGDAPDAVRTLDICANGLGVVVSRSVIPGQQGQVGFSMRIPAALAIRS